MTDSRIAAAACCYIFDAGHVTHGLMFAMEVTVMSLLILLPLISLLGDNRDWLTRSIRRGAAAVLMVPGVCRIF